LSETRFPTIPIVFTVLEPQFCGWQAARKVSGHWEHGGTGDTGGFGLASNSLGVGYTIHAKIVREEENDGY
jgi:hypothetical protein